MGVAHDMVRPIFCPGLLIVVSSFLSAEMFTIFFSGLGVVAACAASGVCFFGAI